MIAVDPSQPLKPSSKQTFRSVRKSDSRLALQMATRQTLKASDQLAVMISLAIGSAIKVL